jgi:hypothetical protein
VIVTACLAWIVAKVELRMGMKLWDAFVDARLRAAPLRYEAAIGRSECPRVHYVEKNAGFLWQQVTSIRMASNGCRT